MRGWGRAPTENFGAPDARVDPGAGGDGVQISPETGSFHPYRRGRLSRPLVVPMTKKEKKDGKRDGKGPPPSPRPPYPQLGTRK